MLTFALQLETTRIPARPLEKRQNYESFCDKESCLIISEKYGFLDSMLKSFFCILNVNQNVKTFITENWIWKVMVLKLISNWVCSRVMNQVLLLWKFCLCKVSSERESHELHIVSEVSRSLLPDWKSIASMFQKRDLSNDQFGEATAAYFSKKGKKDTGNYWV